MIEVGFQQITNLNPKEALFRICTILIKTADGLEALGRKQRLRVRSLSLVNPNAPIANCNKGSVIRNWRDPSLPHRKAE